MSTERFQVQRDGGEVTLQVEVPREAIEAKGRDLLELARARLSIPGFRSGRAPDHLVLRYYGEEEFARDLKEELVEEWLGRALEELGLRPVTTPRVETTAYERGKARVPGPICRFARVRGAR